MVKLRVTARVLPEAEYLAQLDAITRASTPVAGEKRFHIVVQDPETWYIGTLAVAVRQKYQNLYKHDLGQIKYLKHDDDDCDLDPEESVLDLLVNEGRAQTDRSDQHVTIKVIREQGRAVRQGSIIPDLTPLHYQLPVRPPVPRFDQVESSLGKRHADDPTNDTQAAKRRRSRLSEIEEEHDVVATIETGQIADQVIENSQPTQESQTHLDRFGPEGEGPVVSGWSFSQLGPPTAIETSSSNRTPARTAATTSGSPNIRDSSSHRRFLKPVKDIYEYPESEIDDSQNSSGIRRSPKITPRLVSGRASTQRAIDDPLSNNINGLQAAAMDRTTSIAGYPSKRQRRDGSLGEDDSSFAQDKNPSSITNGSTKPKPGNLRALDKGNDGRDDASLNDTNSNQNLRVNARSQAEQAVDTTLQVQGSSRSTHEIVDSLNAAKSRAAVAASTAQLSEKSSTNKTPVKRAKKAATPSAKKKVREGASTELRSETVARLHPSGQMTQKRNASMASKSGEGPETMERRFSTPSPDSPSEQLSQSLQQSARKSMSAKSVSNRGSPDATPKPQASVKVDTVAPRVKEGRLGLGITDSPRKRKGQKATLDQTLSVDNTSLKPSSLENDDVEPRRKRRSRKSLIQETEGSSLPSPKISSSTIPFALAREPSTESSTTRTSAVILPRGMSQAEYDRLIASNAHLNLEPKKAVDRKRSTPSLVKSVSTSSEPDSINAAITATEKADENLENAMGTASNGKLTTTPTNTGKTPAKSTAKSKLGETTSIRAKSAKGKSNLNAIVDVKLADPRKEALSGSSAIPKAKQNSDVSSSTPASKSTPKTMPPPATKSVTKAGSTSSASTPKQSKTKANKSSVPAKTTTSALASSSQPTPTPKPGTTTTAKRPTMAGPNSIYEARSLKELAKLSGSSRNSPSTSVAGSPATTTQQRTSFLGKAAGGPTKKSALFSKPGNQNPNDDSSDENSSSTSSSSDESDSSSSGQGTSQKKNIVRTPGVLPRRPDPSTRKTSVDDDSGSESGSDSSSSDS